MIFDIFELKNMASKEAIKNIVISVLKTKISK